MKQVKVVYSKDVDKTTAEDKTNYKVDGVALATGDTVTLLSDNKTVLVTFATPKGQQTSNDITVSGVKDSTGTKTLAAATNTVTFLDNNLPTFTGTYEQVAPKVVRIFTSEPLSSADATKITINGGAVAVAGATPGISVDKYYVDVTVGSDLVAGDYSFKLGQGTVTDLTGTFKNTDTTLTVKVAPPVGAVTATVTNATQTSVTVKFSSKVDSSLIDASLFYHSYPTYTATSVVDSTGDNIGLDDTYTVSFNGNPLPSGPVKVYVKAKNTAGTKYVVDAFGNKMAADVALDANVQSDTLAPTVTAVKATSATTITVTFDEPVNVVDAQTKANFTFKNSAGQPLATAQFDAAGHPLTTPNLSADGKTVTITLGSALNGGNYILDVANIKDRSINQNKLTAVSKAFTIADTQAPTIIGASLNGSGTAVEVIFSEEMSLDGLTNVANYQLAVNGVRTALPAGTTITPNAAKTGVTINLPAAITGLDGTSDAVYVSNLKDASGTVVNFGENYSISAATGPAAKAFSGSYTAQLSGSKTLKAYFDKPLLSVNSSLVKVNSVVVGNASVADYTFADGSAGSEVTITLPADVAVTDVTNGLAGNLTFDANALTAKNGTKNGSTVTILKTAIKDALVPSVKEISGVKQIKALDTDSNGKVDTISIEYTEGLAAASVGLTSYTVAGKTVTSAKLDDDGAGTPTHANGNKFVMLSVNEVSTGTDTDATYVVSQNAAVQDVNGNNSALLSNETTIDAAGLVLVGAADTQVNASKTLLSSSKAFTVKLKGTLAGAFGNSQQVEIVAADLGAGASKVPTATLASGKLTITINSNADAAAAAVQTLDNIKAAVEAAGDFTVDLGANAGTTVLTASDVATAANFAGGSDTLVLSFSEALDTTTINTADLTTDFDIAGMTEAGTSAVTGASQVTLTVTAASAQVKGAAIGAKAGEVKDVNGNAGVCQDFCV
ncbi:beta strand repeat-containing protein, partial [Brevibacillus agri]|uniref:beta strand repeat-containing protein n=1 Tax=Brevibacillus agri TaxID=51101 RepID=UPI003D19AA5E